MDVQFATRLSQYNRLEVSPPRSLQSVTDPTLLNETHDPRARSWLASANAADCEFPIQNLPFAVFRRGDSTEEFRGGVAIGDQIVGLAALAKLGGFEAQAAEGIQAGGRSSLNSLMQRGPTVWGAVTPTLFHGLRE